jgi:ABC-type glycerol-3-phosphate transport system substrate-binding protein
MHLSLRILLLGVLLLTGCNVGGAPAAVWPTGVPPRNAAIGGTPITLNVWFAADYVDQVPIVDLIADFERAYPNITVERTGVVWEDMLERVELAVSQGNPPDLAHGHAFAFAAQGLAENLDDLWTAWGAESEFMPGAMEDCIWQSQIYGVPLDINTLFTIYNRKLFDEAGVAPPDDSWTFDEMYSMVTRLTAPDGSRYGMALSASGWDLSGLVRAAGGDLLTEDDGRVMATLNDPAVLKVLSLWHKMGVQDRVGTLPPPQPRQSDAPVALFQQGKVAMFFSGPWDLTRLRNEAPEMMENVGTAPLPHDGDPAKAGSVQGGGSMFVPRGARHREAAFELMKWATSDSYAKRLAAEMGRYPVKKAQYNDAALSDDPLLRPFIDQLERAKPYRFEAYRGANNAWTEAVRAAFEPNADIPALLEQAQTRAQAAIDEVEAASNQ